LDDPQRVEALAGQSEVEVVVRRAGAVVGEFDKQPVSVLRVVQSDLANLRNHHPRRRHQRQSHFVGEENLVQLVVAAQRQLSENSAQRVGANFPP
jgi:hypothetical protein